MRATENISVVLVPRVSFVAVFLADLKAIFVEIMFEIMFPPFLEGIF